MRRSRNMNKVVIMTSGHVTFDTRVFHKHAISLAQAGYDVTLITQHSRNETVNGVKIIGVPYARNRYQRIIGLTCRILYLASKERAKICHFHDLALIPAGIVLKLLGAKVIYDVHEDYPATMRKSEWLPSFTRNIIAAIFDLFERAIQYLFDYIVPTTEHISTRFRKEKTVILHNYPILHFATDKVNNVDSSCKDHTIIYAGLLTRPRGLKEVVQSLEYIDEGLQVRLSLLGKYSDVAFRDELEVMEAFSKVDFTEPVPFTEVYSYLAAADVGIVTYHPFPNHIEAMPIKMFEYMLAGLPIIASDFPLWKEIVEGNNCGLTVDPMNPQAIAAAVEYLLREPELMAEMSSNGRKAVLERYNWKRESEKLLNLYAELSGK